MKAIQQNNNFTEYKDRIVRKGNELILVGNEDEMPTTIDTTDHAASAAAPRIEARAGAAESSPTSEIDTAKPLAFMLIVR